MTHRTPRQLVLSNDEVCSSTRLWLRKLFHRRSYDRHYCTFVTPSPLYLACQNNDLAGVESCLKKMKLEEINYQHPPNNETALHVATRKQHKEMIEILLQYGVQPSLRNIEGQCAYELAETEKIKDLFKRPESSRFAFLHSCYNITPLSQDKLSCKSCLLVNNNTMYEWELVDRNATQKAVIFRRELKAYSSMGAKFWKKKLYSLNKGYFTAHSQDISPVDGAVIQNCFKQALLEQNPNYLVIAYTSCQKFSNSLNIDMARNVMHALNNGCSQFSCQCLYSTQDGTKSISSIFLHHPNFQKLDFKGEVYRGIVMPKHKFSHCKVGSSIITTTFLSTSKDRLVAQGFGDKCVLNSAMHSFFCTYMIINDSRTAIDISKLSTHPEEDEVLILPYSPFLITKIEEKEEITNIYLKEQCSADIFGKNQSNILNTPISLKETLVNLMSQLCSQPMVYYECVIDSSVELEKNSNVSEIIHLSTPYRPADNETLDLNQIAASVCTSQTAVRTVVQRCAGDYEINIVDLQAKKPLDVQAKIIARPKSNSRKMN
ncbi:unnamed protein product [Rotaria socialis]|uniref:NAD(P)(+)--arginine ADP-ribosyltransferase n=1 Tax=Rotaria socialis TaxID=392032 RepID=A0A820NTH8_9BILA|nr:unnamed protein product [Rotaria socialis]